jgi:uncharacterized protein YggE
VEEEMKLNILLVVAALMLVIMAATACAPAPVIYQGTTTATSGGIIVSQQNLGLWVDGNGKTNSAPDVVVLSLGVQSEQKTVAQAQKEAVDAMGKIIQVLKGSGIADKDIQTRQFNIQQMTRWDDKQNTTIVTGYRVSNMVDVKVREITKAGSVIDSVATAGGDLTRINGINFSVDDPAPLYKIAREKAIQAATDKAKQMAQASGVKLGKILYITESTINVPVPLNTLMMKSAYGGDVAAAPTSISGGELEFRVTVQIVYELN